MKGLLLENINLSYDGKNNILEQYSLEIKPGELLGLLGPSGCGKSTTLSLVAGFITPDSGTIELEGQDISNVKPEDRFMGVVFQSYALFPHLTIFDNISFGLKERKIDNVNQRTEEILKRVGLYEHKDKYPKALSGGQQQRIALARAVVMNPDVLLLDEPLSNLDVKLRLEMRELIREIQQEYKITCLFVTHDQEECFAISDRVAVMNKGKIVQIDKPDVIFNRPVDSFVADFVGIENIFDGSVIGQDGLVGIRSKDISFADEGLSGEITSKLYSSGRHLYRVQANGIEFKVLSYKDYGLGSNVSISFKQEKVVKLER
ncbi:ABC transporter ATP-binding protein [Mollicutes bacterium LVI A0078]|nr:ABC transporter ATP-binding protein [Mollicutes bacterium LVI A0075]WOO90145.1 ABC transporter ATP-binding protein [Mollicutes bacterium LVI A0078]